MLCYYQWIVLRLIAKPICFLPISLNAHQITCSAQQFTNHHIHGFYSSFSFELMTHAGYWGKWRFSSHLCQELLHRLHDSLPSDLVLHPSERSVLMSFTTMVEVSTRTFLSTEAILTDVPPDTWTTDQSVNPPINQLTDQSIYQSRTS